jgi:hypothetical protein
MNCPKCGFANPDYFTHCGMCGTLLPEPEPQVVFGVSVLADQNEPYLLYQNWFEEKPRIVSRERHQMNMILTAALLALNLFVWVPLVGFLWASIIVLATLLVTIPLARLNFKKARKRAEDVKAKRG